MKKEKILMLQELLVTQMNHWILFLLAVSVMGVIGTSRPVLWKWAVCSLLPLFFGIVRRFSNHFLVFVISHVLPVVFVIMVPSDALVEKIALALMVIGYVAYSFYLRVMTEERLDGVLHPAAAVGIAGLGILLQHYQGIQDWESYYVPPLIIFLGLYFVQLYLEQYQHFMIVNDSSKGQIPEKEMFRSGIMLVVFFSAAVMVVLLLTSDIGWVGQITSVLKAILIWLIRLLVRGKETTEEVPIEEQEVVTKQDTGWMPVEDAEPSMFWIILEKIVIVLVYALMIAICIGAIYALVTYLYKRFSQILNKEEDEPEEVMDVREKCEVERFRKERKPLFEFLSTRERIRRMYKKEVWASRMQLVADGSPAFLKRLTARECGQVMERESLAQVYEKARYSEEECTSEDIRKAKEK